MPPIGLCTTEQIVVDCIELMSTGEMPATHEAVVRVVKLVAISERMVVDGSFARQVKRKL